MRTNIAGMLEILKLERHNTELGVDDSVLRLKSSRLQSEEPNLEEDEEEPMTINPEDKPLTDEVPVADAVEQQQPAAPDVEDAGLDSQHVADRLLTDANAFDVIDQAISVPLPDDERDDDTD